MKYDKFFHMLNFNKLKQNGSSQNFKFYYFVQNPCFQKCLTTSRMLKF